MAGKRKSGAGRAAGPLGELFERAPDGIAVIGADGRIEVCNPALGRLFGHDAKDLGGQPLTILGTSLDLPAAGRWPKEGTWRREGVGQRKDGSSLPLEMAANTFQWNGRQWLLVVLRDITRQRITEDALREAEERMGDVTANLPVVVFRRQRATDGRISYLYVSPSAGTLLGLDAEELLGESEGLFARIHPDDRERTLAHLRRSADTLEPTDEDYRVLDRGRQVRWLRGAARPRRLPNGDVIWDGVVIDVTNQQRAAEHLRYLAFFDPLTGTLNRMGFQDRFEKRRDEAARLEERLAVLSVGLERFGIINDTLGHAIGDEALRAVSRRLATCLRDGDALARPGGNTFVILLTRCGDGSEPAATIERLLGCFETSFTVEERRLDITASVGVSLYPRDGNDAETLVKNSGSALRRARELSPGSYQFFDESTNARVVQAMTLESRLRQALKNEEFTAYFQPQIEIASGRITGMEALARWRHPRLGLVPPAEFIEVAEASGLIGEIGERMLRLACRQIRSWQEAGLAPPPVAVNVSARQFAHPRRFLSVVEAVLAETGLDPRHLEVELTESSIMERPEETVRLLEHLRAQGIAASIDDFGTGYSSLGYLKRFPIAKLKIDRSFVVDVDDGGGRALVDAVIALAHALGLRVVAEGVENWRQFQHLRARGCEQIQGYLFSPPVPENEMGTMLREGRRLMVSEVLPEWDI